MRPTALLIDLDGVLRRWAPDDVALERACGLPPGALRETAFASDLILPAISGAIDDATWRERVTERLRARHPLARVDLVVREWSRPCGEVDVRVLDLLRRVRARTRVVLVTNATTRLPSDLEALGLLGELDHVINSAEVGAAKPEPAILEAALRAAGASAAEVLFVDDAPVNVQAAARLGCRAHHYRDSDGLEGTLRDLGLLT